MTNIGEEAQAYTPPQTKNIADLEVVPRDANIEERTFTVEKDGEKKEVTIKVIIVNGEEYRVPAIVLKQLKEHIAESPGIQSFKVSKTGSGLNTAYTVIPKDTGVPIVKVGEEAVDKSVQGETPAVPQ